ncbi:bifunctional RNase H/acid phosphatase [Streptomyces sp. YIM 130001]|uniref:histidine phosphatase family protein n=1 Tax=Streptomyces sp. YIM 130001 TaxID=2259644 RepID=UPI000E652346|nr:histidine phosphatase family protein [Streptomyces sp. YIM 130001]RII08556.1 bifunctional RNase H/acid phosphatase [Streptomyces sp. YIM 130001]
MPPTATRYLHVVRHGEARPDETGLTDQGLRQAELLGRRLRDVPFAAVHHGPLPRAAESARAIAAQLQEVHPDVPVYASEPAGDYVPYVPDRTELPPDSADLFLRFVAGTPQEERLRGPELARRALGLFTGPVDGDTDRHELVVTHNFLAAWLVRDAMHAPHWRWLGLNHANAALTVISYPPDRPATVLTLNDMRHLPADLRWTGFPDELREARW